MKFIKSADDIVLEIHNKIDTAQERLLKEALNIINSTSVEDLDSDLVNPNFFRIFAYNLKTIL